MKDKFDRIHCFLLKIRLIFHLSCTQHHNVWVTIYEIYAFHSRNGNVVLLNQPRQLFLIRAAPWSDNNDKDLSVKTINIHMLHVYAADIITKYFHWLGQNYVTRQDKTEENLSHWRKIKNTGISHYVPDQNDRDRYCWLIWMFVLAINASTVWYS